MCQFLTDLFDIGIARGHPKNPSLTENQKLNCIEKWKLNNICRHYRSIFLVHPKCICVHWGGLTVLPQTSL